MSDSPEAVRDLLKRLRTAAGLSQVTVGERAKRNQPWISRFERGDRVPTKDEAEFLISLYRPTAKDARRLRAVARDLLDDANLPARMVVRRAGDMQRRIGRIEASSRRIATFAAVVLPGLLQTERYMRVVFASGGDLPPDQQAAALAERLARVQLLNEPGREFVFVLTEGSLRWRMGSATLMADQLDHIVETSRRPGVRVGVIPWTTTVRVAPLHGFDLHDRRAAIVGIETATAFLTNPHDVDAYVKLFAELEELASFGDDARTVLATIASEYRTTD